MSDLKSRIGESVGPFEFEVKPDHVRQFGQAVAASEQFGVPPTYLVTVSWTGDSKLFVHLDIDLRRVLHGDEEYRYIKPIKDGAKLFCTTRLENVHEKKGRSGMMQFVAFQSDIKDSSGELVAQCKKTIVIR